MIGIFFFAFLFLNQFQFLNFFPVLFIFLVVQFFLEKKFHFLDKLNFSFRFYSAFFIFFYILHFYLIIENHFESFFLTDFDYIGIEEIINHISKGNFFKTNHYGKFSEANYLSHHFAFILVLFVPFQFFSELKLGYAYSNLFLLFINLFLIYKILDKSNLSEKDKIYSFLALAMNPFFYRLNLSYHFEIIYLSFILAAFYYKQTKNQFLEFSFFFILLFIKEDIAIYQILISIFIYSIEKEKKYLYYAFFSGIYFLFLKLILIPEIGDSAKVNWAESWSYITNQFFDLKTWVFLALEKILQKKNIFVSIVILFFIPFLFFKRLILFLFPILILHFSSDRIWYNSFYNYYSYTILPFLVFAFLYKLNHLAENKYLTKFLILTILFATYYFYLDKSIPYKKQITKQDRIEILEEAIQYIPKNSKLRTSFDTGAFFPRNIELYPLKQFQLTEEFILLDKNSISPFVVLDEIYAEMESKKNEYELIFQKKDLFLWRRIKLTK